MAAYTKKIPLGHFAILLLKVTVAAFLMRASACTINDILDRNFDAQVERTKSRPLAAKKLSVQSATFFLIFQYILGIIFFYYSRFWAGMFQMFPLCVCISIDFTIWPQAWLAIAINFGFIVAWTEVHGNLSILASILMMSSLWCWTMMYDTVYGYQDRRDDVKVGIWSTAIFFGDRFKPVLSLTAASFVGILLTYGVLYDHGVPFFVICIGGSALYLVWQIGILDLSLAPSCWNFFTCNAYYLGSLISFGLFVDYFSSVANLGN